MAHKEDDPGNVAMIGRMIDSAGRRLAGYDPDQLEHLYALHARVDHAMVTAITGQRAQGVHWSSIAAALGVTKAAVIQRWGPRVSA